ncbi:Gamma-aminobutyric acid type B receptor subunit 2 [Dermatophagoides farinae]|uniref:Gamma-aminobutyric acid type B receptor subunit 2 n=1 Tax=Dermatophagoides farinae TaxID=6954 RepID=A0A922HNR6_DERFA|nr:Gamma-aminobutyric acid type B receptor subunit 2 [Dermatophagoides farinae]
MKQHQQKFRLQNSTFFKTWRVHAIFTDIKLNKKLIKDYKLFMVVGVLVFIDVATLTTWQIVDPFYRVTSQGKPELHYEKMEKKYNRIQFFVE